MADPVPLGLPDPLDPLETPEVPDLLEDPVLLESLDRPDLTEPTVPAPREPEAEEVEDTLLEVRVIG